MDCLTRILQEYQRSPTKNGDGAIAVALRTDGHVVFVSAKVTALRVSAWYFLSFFRFMTVMGDLLALIIFMKNLPGAVPVVPAVTSVFEPRFALPARLLLWD